MESKATELNTGIRNTIEQLANETDAARQSELFCNYLKISAAFCIGRLTARRLRLVMAKKSTSSSGS